MDLKDTAKILYQQARMMKEAGKVPEFLGIKGMLARIYDNITRYSDSNDKNGDYVLDIAVNALFALNMVYSELELDPNNDHEIPMELEIPNDEDPPDDGRPWKAIPPQK